MHLNYSKAEVTDPDDNDPIGIILCADKPSARIEYVLGGLENRSGIIVDGSLEDIREEVHRLRREMKGKKFILGADCTLGSDLPVERIRTATEAARDSL